MAAVVRCGRVPVGPSNRIPYLADGTERDPAPEAPIESLTSKQRAYLVGLVHDERPVLQIGKAGAGDAVRSAVEEALAARELVKLRVLDTAPSGPRETAAALAAALGGEVVQVVGRVVVLYRKAGEPRLRLPGG